MDKKHLLKPAFWLFLALSSLLFRGMMPAEWFEEHYSMGFFLWIRKGFDAVVGKVPFPVGYLVIGLFLVFLAISGFRFFKMQRTPRQKAIQLGLNLVSFSCGLTFFFLLLWGFNYKRIPVATKLQLENTPLTLEQIQEEIKYHTAIIASLRDGIPEVNDLGAVVPVSTMPTPNNLQDLMRESLEKVLRDNGYQIAGKVNCRDLRPEGLLLRFSTSGVYFPFSGEGHVDAALHPLQKPFVIAHEMAHGYGFTDEGVCNFWAYLACIHSDNLFIRYVGHLNFWRYMASAWKLQDPEGYQKFRDGLPAAILADLNTINENLNQYPDILPGLRNLVYDTFLKAQGIDEGLENYDRVIPLVSAWWAKMRQK